MRRPRFTLSQASSVQHCISRIVAGEFLLAQDPEKDALRGMMRRQAAFCGVQIVTYCLMSNHFHILTRIPVQPPISDSELLGRVEAFYGQTAPESLRIAESISIGGAVREQERNRLLKRMNNVSVFMEELKQTFSVWYNKKHKRFGTLWSERFRNVLVEDRPEVVQIVAAYIDLNPVRAGLVQDPSNYRFCGYAEAAVGNALAIGGIESFTGAEGGEWRRVVGRYREALFNKGASDGSDEKPGIPLEKVREIWKSNGELSEADALRLKIRYMKDGAVLGSRAFVDEVFRTFRDRFGPRRTTGARPMRHLPFKGLFTLRDLRVSAIE